MTEAWELIARESVRDVITRYNSNGDGGRFDAVLALFADDAVMEFHGHAHRGAAEIRTVFTGTQSQLATAPTAAAPGYVRHFTATHQIDVIDRTHATSRCYFAAVTRIGLDHWGRYVDQFVAADEVWKFASRRVLVDGQAANSVFPRA